MSLVDRLRQIPFDLRLRCLPKESVPNGSGSVISCTAYTGDTKKLDGGVPSPSSVEGLVPDLPDSLIEFIMNWSEFAKLERSIYDVPVAKVVFRLSDLQSADPRRRDLVLPFVEAELVLRINPFNAWVQGNGEAGILQWVLVPEDHRVLLSPVLKNTSEFPDQLRSLFPLMPKIGINHRKPAGHFELKEYFPIFYKHPLESKAMALGIFDEEEDQGILFFTNRGWRGGFQEKDNQQWHNLRNQGIECFNKYFPALVAYLLDGKDKGEGVNMLKVWRNIVRRGLERGDFAAFSPLFPKEPEIFGKKLEESAGILLDVTNRFLTAIALLYNEMRSVNPPTTWEAYRDVLGFPRESEYFNYNLPDFDFRWLNVSNYAPEKDPITQKKNRTMAQVLERFLFD